MTISDRIQELRKQKGLSQEQLAEILNVSRQAISKWESNQSTPEIDKIIAMSEYFTVSTDYLLKGSVDSKDQDKNQDNVQKKDFITGNLLLVASTAFIAMGLLLAIAGWYEEQTAGPIVTGLIVQILGLSGYFVSKLYPQNPKYLKPVTIANLWLLLVIPMGLILIFFMSYFNIAFSFITYLFGLYILIATVGTVIIIKKSKSKKV